MLGVDVGDSHEVALAHIAARVSPGPSMSVPVTVT